MTMSLILIVFRLLYIYDLSLNFFLKDLNEIPLCQKAKFFKQQNLNESQNYLLSIRLIIL